jgi:hypothetical protein
LTGRHARPRDIPPTGPTAPLSISAIRDSDTVVDALAARRLDRPAASDGDDPAVRLLQSLILDVDQGAPAPAAKGAPAPTTAPAPTPTPTGRSRRRGARTVMALGISTAVFGTTGVAAASGELGKTFERTIGVHQPSGQANKSSRGEAEGTGRTVVRAPAYPAEPVPSSTSEAHGSERVSRNAAAGRTRDGFPRRAAADRDGPRTTGADQPARDGGQVSGEVPGDVPETPTGPDPDTTPTPRSPQDDDPASTPTGVPISAPTTEDDENPGTGDDAGTG